MVVVVVVFLAAANPFVLVFFSPAAARGHSYQDLLVYNHQNIKRRDLWTKEKTN